MSYIGLLWPNSPLSFINPGSRWPRLTFYLSFSLLLYLFLTFSLFFFFSSFPCYFLKYSISPSLSYLFPSYLLSFLLSPSLIIYHFIYFLLSPSLIISHFLSYLFSPSYFLLTFYLSSFRNGFGKWKLL